MLQVSREAHLQLPTSEVPVDETIAKPPIKRFKLLSQDTVNRSVNRTAASSTTGPRYTIEAELARYLSEAAECETQTAVEFWQDRQRSYSMIGPLALDIVSCPASQAYVERVFSLCGDLSARKRNRATTSLERRAFLKLNSKLFCEQL